MKTIKFSDRYTKHPIPVKDGSIIRLIEVLNSKFENLHESFIEYDTRYYTKGHYNLLKSGDCLVLLFLGAGSVWDSSELFTTVRRQTPAKDKYYKSCRGEEFIVKIKNKTLK